MKQLTYEYRQKTSKLKKCVYYNILRRIFLRIAKYLNRRFKKTFKVISAQEKEKKNLHIPWRIGDGLTLMRSICHPDNMKEDLVETQFVSLHRGLT